MIFRATDTQVKQILCNAVNASISIGMGFFQFKKRKYNTINVEFFNKMYCIDYYDDRTVKLFIRKLDADEWKIFVPQDFPNIEYQSWKRVYPTKKLLVESVIKQ